MKPEITPLKTPSRSRSQLISDAKALSNLLLRLEKESKSIDPHAALRLAEIILELYPSKGDGK